MSAEIQESLNNFKVIVAFNRIDYFREKFKAGQRAELSRRRWAQAWRTTCSCRSTVWPTTSRRSRCWPTASCSSQPGQLTVGLLIGFLLYVNSFYMPLRQLAMVWARSSLRWRRSIASQRCSRWSRTCRWCRRPNLSVRAPPSWNSSSVAFSYPGGREVSEGRDIQLEQGKTYAFVGPTGGGKTTTASLMAASTIPPAGPSCWTAATFDPIRRKSEAGRSASSCRNRSSLPARSATTSSTGTNGIATIPTNSLLKCCSRTNLDRLLARFEAGARDEGAPQRRHHQPGTEAADCLHAGGAEGSGDTDSG